jgi:hypothetical protein
MLWWLMAGLFTWLALRALRHGFAPPPGMGLPEPGSAIRTALLFGLIAGAFAFTPIRYKLFEKRLTEHARTLSGKDYARVHCNTMGDTLFSPESLAAGYAEIETGKIYFQYPYCARLMDHLQHPQRLTAEELFSMQIFVHEVMHVRGERKEAATECQALQRYAQASMLLGVPKETATKNGSTYYRLHYQLRSSSGEFSAAYYSPECAPGKAMDESLPDMEW